METKKCKKCKIEKLLLLFPKHKNMKDDYENQCKECRKKQLKEWNKQNPDYYKKWLLENKDKRKKQLKEWNKQNPDYYKQYNKQYYKQHHKPIKKEKLLLDHKRCIKCKKVKHINEFFKHKEMKDGYLNQCKKCKKQYMKHYIKENKEEIKNQRKQQYEKNKEKHLNKSREWKKNNPEKAKKLRNQWKKINPNYYNNYTKERYNNDIEYKILHNLRSRLRSALKGKLKSDTTINLIGCSIKKLKNHLKEQFYDEMNWNNYGKYWEIDHIIPCSLFDLTKEDQQRKCFHYTNLQSLTIKHNRQKNNKLDWVKTMN